SARWTKKLGKTAWPLSWAKWVRAFCPRCARPSAMPTPARALPPSRRWLSSDAMGFTDADLVRSTEAKSKTQGAWAPATGGFGGAHVGQRRELWCPGIFG